MIVKGEATIDNKIKIDGFSFNKVILFIFVELYIYVQ